MAAIASSATSVLIAHVAAHTRTIRLGAGGIMLPNHSPLVIAEQFGTLASLHPGRIDLGVGRAPGSDQDTARALRRDVFAADRFPEDVLELQGYLTGHSRVEGVDAVPGKGTERAALRPRLVVVRRAARGAPRSAVRVRVALRSTGARTGGGHLPAGVPAVDAARRRRTSSRA